MNKIIDSDLSDMLQEFFTSFLHRDKVFDLISTLWRKNKGEESLGINIRSLIKQEQQAAKPQPDSSVPETRKKSITTADTTEPQEPVATALSPRETSPEPAPSAPVVVQTNSTETSPTSHPEEPVVTEERHTAEKNQRKTSLQHPLDLNLLRSGSKPKKKIIKRDSTIPEEILQEIEHEQKKEEAPEEQKAEEAEESSVAEDFFKGVLFPDYGKFAEHISIDNEPCINRVYANITPKEFYARLLYSPEFWEHVFVVTDSTDINIPQFQLPNDGAVYLERICKFVAPIKGAPMGPKQTRVRQTHRVSMPDEK